MPWGPKDRTHGSCELSEVDPASWVEWASAIVDGGVLLSLGRSRDGGALSIAYVHNGAKDREWFSDAESFADGMRELAVKLRVVDDLTGARSAPPVPSGPPEGRKRGSASR